MKGVGFGLGVVLFVNSFAALADDSQQSRYATAFSVGSGSGLSVKKVWGDTNQTFAGFSLSLGGNQTQYTSPSGTSNDTKGLGYTLFTGTRHFLEKGQLSKFIQLSLSGTYYSTSGSDGFTSRIRSANLLPGYGLEYFLTPDLSIEGVMGLSYTYSKVNNSLATPSTQLNYTTKSYSFPTVGMSITYYW